MSDDRASTAPLESSAATAARSPQATGAPSCGTCPDSCSPAAALCKSRDCSVELPRWDCKAWGGTSSRRGRGKICGRVSSGSPQCLATLAGMLAATLIWYCWHLYAETSALILANTYFPESVDRDLQSYIIFSTGFTARPIGGLLFGHWADRRGRRHAMLCGLCTTSLATAFIGLLPSYDSIHAWAPRLLTLLRVLQGLGFGGAWAGTILLAYEWCPQERRRGFFAALPQAAVGNGVALSCFLLWATGGNDDSQVSRSSWRLPHLAQLPLALVVAALTHTKVTETPDWARAKRRREIFDWPILEVMRRQWRNVVLGMAMLTITGILQGLSLGWGMPVLARVGHMPLHLQLPLIGGTGLLISGCTVLGGYLADCCGRRRTYITCSLVLVAAAPTYVILLLSYASPAHPWALYWANLIVLVGLFGTMQGAFPALLADLFPPSLRYSGTSLIHLLSCLHVPAFFPLIARRLLGPTHQPPGTGKADPTNLCLYIAAAALVSALAAAMVQIYTPLRRRVSTLKAVSVSALDDGSGYPHPPSLGNEQSWLPTIIELGDKEEEEEDEEEEEEEEEGGGGGAGGGGGGGRRAAGGGGGGTSK